MNIGLFCASSNSMDAIYYENASRLGSWLAEHGHTLVYGGANCGLMQATAKAVIDNGGQAIGIVPKILCQHNRVSEYITRTIFCENLHERKDLLISNSDLIVVMPGSVGTLDEAFTVMAANTIGIHDKRLIFWNINGFWDELFVLLEALKGKGVVNKPMESLYTIVNNIEELEEAICKAE